MRAADGGGASGPYSLPGKVRMSTDSATSKRWSSLQATIDAASGVRSGQFRQSPLWAWLNASLPRAPDSGIELAEPVSPVGPLLLGSAVSTPAMSKAPSAV